jgi:hypothetical protein
MTQLAASEPRATKVRRNLTFSPEAAAFLDAQPNASAAADEAVLAAMERQREQEALRAYLDELAAEIGPPDPDEVARAVALLSS